LETPFQEIVISKEGSYNELPSGKANVIISGKGTIELSDNNGGGKKIYTILPSKNIIIIKDFSTRFDQIDLIHFPNLYSLKDLVYRTNPLQLILSAEQKLILSTFENLNALAEENFLFQKKGTENENNKKTKVGNTFHLELSLIVSLGILIGCVVICGFLVKMNTKDNRDAQFDKESQKWFVADEQENESDKLSSDFGSISSSYGSSLFQNDKENDEKSSDFCTLDGENSDDFMGGSLGSQQNERRSYFSGSELEETNEDYHFIRELLGRNNAKEEEEVEDDDTDDNNVVESSEFGYHYQNSKRFGSYAVGYPYDDFSYPIKDLDQIGVNMNYHDFDENEDVTETVPFFRENYYNDFYDGYSYQLNQEMTGNDDNIGDLEGNYHIEEQTRDDGGGVAIEEDVLFLQQLFFLGSPTEKWRK
jgi:hypothetical protein